jgi:hypothetical protein
VGARCDKRGVSQVDLKIMRLNMQRHSRLVCRNDFK